MINRFQIVLEEDVTEVEEVVVNGIFQRKAGSFTGSALTMKGEDLKKVSNSNVFASLKNLDPSLMIFDNLEFGSDPNKMPTMALRGKTAFDLGSDDIDLKEVMQMIRMLLCLFWTVLRPLFKNCRFRYESCGVVDNFEGCLGKSYLWI